MSADMMVVAAAAPFVAEDITLPKNRTERMRILEKIGVTTCSECAG